MPQKQKKILVAPLNWGLGHASRSVVVVNFLLKNNYEPVIASDGEALVFFKKEFPHLTSLELPSYGIQYSKKGFWLPWKLLFSFFSILKAVRKEHRIVEEYVRKNSIDGIISDNRFGLYNSSVPTVYITHQIQVLFGVFTGITSAIHQKIIAKYDQCWVPDFESENSLAGKLSFSKNKINSVKYIGNLSRLTFQKQEKKYDVLLLLSGPEPQRTLLENHLYRVFENYSGKVLLIRGVFHSKTILKQRKNFEILPYLLTEDLQKTILQSDLVICRSGYSTIMDLAKLKKRAFFIPTPGQTEQEYLAKLLQQKKVANFSMQNNFTLAHLHDLKQYLGFTNNWETLLDESFLVVFKTKKLN